MICVQALRIKALDTMKRNSVFMPREEEAPIDVGHIEYWPIKSFLNQKLKLESLTRERYKKKKHIRKLGNRSTK